MWEERCNKGLSLLVRDQIGKLRMSEPIEVFPESLLVRNEHIAIFFFLLISVLKTCFVASV